MKTSSEKPFDCVEMKRQIQDRIARETAGMTPEQEIEHTRSSAAAFRAELAASPAAGSGNFKALFEASELEQEKRGNL